MSHAAKALGHHPTGSRLNGNGVLREAQHDAYRLDRKLPRGTRCPECHAQVRRGRWTWAEAAPAARSVLCPACRRQREGQAAAEIDLTGRYVAEHEADLVALVQRIASRELAEHPLERLMQLERVAPGHLHLRTTGLHLPRALGHALERAHHGELAQDYAPDSLRLRMRWHRDA